MRTPSWFIIGIIFVLDIVAFGLAIGAETQRSQATKVKNINDVYCQYTQDKASGLAIGALVFLLIGQAIVMGLTSCLCCSATSYKPGKHRIFAIVFFCLSWTTFIISELCLLVGARLNTLRTRSVVNFSDDGDPADDLHCRQVKKSLFAAGAAFTFLTLCFSELYYISVTRASEGSWQESYNNGAPTISMSTYP
ncbi:hypothetical protein R1sor_016609 [Riccia sorocarpa]|uniref:Uncharacterized protein n=1 Tax=Riccia sorocarpa TaxID=122646 RepID=A0ABD3HFF6_9MARC